MIAWKFKAWRTTGAAVALSALAACGGEGGEQGAASGGEGGEGGGEAGEAAVTAPESPGATAPAGGEAGEAGAASAYAGLSSADHTALRIQHLKGFVMAASRLMDDEAQSPSAPQDAAVLVQQGLLEVYDAAPGEFGDLNAALVRTAAEGGELGRAQMIQRLRAAEDELDRAGGAAHGDGAVVTARMVDIATGLYQQVIQTDFVDPIEYQHSMGAALAAQSALAQHQSELRRRNMGAYSEAQAALNRFVGLWPQPTAPQQPTAYRDVLAQGSRVRLALSPYL